MTDYETIDHNTPPTLEEDNGIKNTLLRLESITACLIMKNKNKCNILSQVPCSLHTVIWKAYLREKYYNHRDLFCNENILSIDFSGLFELLHQWPKDDFALNEQFTIFFKSGSFV